MGRGWKGTYQVNVDVGKPLGRNGNVDRKELDMAVGFCGVAGGAGTAPAENIMGEVRPDISGGDEAAGGPVARVSKAVEVLEKEVA